MSKIIFVTSQKEIDLSKWGIKKIEPNAYVLEHYPYLKKFNCIYDFEEFNYSTNYKEFVNYLLNQANDNYISFLVLWQTQNIEEVYELNTDMQNKNIISMDDNSKLYDLIYRLESDTLSPSTEYEFVKQ